jgi:hypothetical protein
MRDPHKILVRKLQGKRPFGIPRHRWEGNIRMDLGETQDREHRWAVLKMVMNFQMPWKARSFPECD